MTQQAHPLCTFLTRTRQKVAVIAKFKNILRVSSRDQHNITFALAYSYRQAIARTSPLRLPLSRYPTSFYHRTLYFLRQQGRGLSRIGDTLPPITGVLIGVGDFSSHTHDTCTRVRMRARCACSRRRLAPSMCCMQMVRRRTVGGCTPNQENRFRLRARVTCAWSRTEGHAGVRVCVRDRALARTQRAVFCSSVCTAVGIMSHRVSGSVTLTCAPSVPDGSPTSVHAQRLRTTKIRRTTHVYVCTYRGCTRPTQADVLLGRIFRSQVSTFLRGLTFFFFVKYINVYM